MSTNNENNETKTNEDNHQEVVIDSQPTSCLNEPKLSEEEELATLGLRPNTVSPDPCACFGCVFCVNLCFMPPHTASNGTTSGPDVSNLVWALVLTTNITLSPLNWGDDSDSDSSSDSSCYAGGEGKFTS